MPQKHLIEKLSANVHFTGISGTSGLQNEVAEFIHFDWLPELSILFDSLCPEGVTIRLETINLNIGNLSVSDWKSELREQANKLIAEKIREHRTNTSGNVNTGYRAASTTGLMPQPSQGIASHSFSLREELYTFLEHGTLPWYSRKHPRELIESFVKLFEDTSSQNIEFLFSFITSETALHRLIFHLNQVQRRLFWDALFKPLPVPPAVVFEQSVLFCIISVIALQKIRNFAPLFLEDFVNLPLPESGIVLTQSEQQSIAEWAISADSLFQDMLMSAGDFLTQSDAMFHDSHLYKTESLPTQKSGIRDEGKSDSVHPQTVYYIQNAGLVLLHPYFSFLFESLGWMKDLNWVDENLQKNAVLVLHQMVYGDTESINEHDLLLNKILVGLPIETPVDIGWKIPDAVKTAAAEVPEAAIEHWPALKNTSAEGLVNTFLMREGRLTITSEFVHLKVDRKGTDVLLGSLPWTIGTITHPFMKTVLHTEW